VIPDHVGRLARLLATSPAESADAGSIEASGRVDKAELSLRTAKEVDAAVTVVYGAQPNLSVFVPISMHEHYGQAFADKIEAFATYSDCVVLTVTVDVTRFKEAVDSTGRGGALGKPPRSAPMSPDCTRAREE
jgi:hypothetical protein